MVQTKEISKFPLNVKLTKARITKYNVNEVPPYSSYDGSNKSLKSQETNQEIQRKVIKLKNKLAETNTNLSLLRSWVGETIDVVKRQKPKSTKEIVDELKELIVKVDEYEDLNGVIAKRGEECMNLLEELEKQKCCCSLSSPSCEEIKNQMQYIMTEMSDLDATIEEMQNKNMKSESLGFVVSMVDEAKKELSDVAKACTLSTCVKREKKEDSVIPKAVMETGMQANSPATLKRPKLMQTDANPKWDQGTSPLCENVCCTPNSNKKKHC